MAKSTRKRPAPPAARAVALLGRWTRLSQGHLPFGSGCSCGAPAVSIRLADLERDVLDYLAGRHASACGAPSIAELLRGKPDASLLDDLERSLASFEELHG
jgi:hypothetical protein